MEQAAASLSSSPWIQRASSALAPSGPPSDSGGDRAEKKQSGAVKQRQLGFRSRCRGEVEGS